ncbi:MAG: hypothetical protein ACYCSF_08400 [Acidimicrobiales bacterium]
MPSIWELEVAKVLLVAERRSRITKAQATRFLDLLPQLPICIDGSTSGFALLFGPPRHGRAP